jgi:hypothetical protein
MTPLAYFVISLHGFFGTFTKTLVPQNVGRAVISRQEASLHLALTNGAVRCFGTSVCDAGSTLLKGAGILA